MFSTVTPDYSASRDCCIPSARLRPLNHHIQHVCQYTPPCCSLPNACQITPPETSYSSSRPDYSALLFFHNSSARLRPIDSDCTFVARLRPLIFPFQNFLAGRRDSLVPVRQKILFFQAERPCPLTALINPPSARSYAHCAASHFLNGCAAYAQASATFLDNLRTVERLETVVNGWGGDLLLIQPSLGEANN